MLSDAGSSATNFAPSLTPATRSWGTVTDEQSDSLLHVVQAIAMSPADVKKLVRRLREQSERKSRARSEPELEERVADHIVSRYARWASTSGGLTALTGVVPGLGTALAAVGGAATDVAVCMKLQVDMCMCLAETFGHDVLTPDAQHLAFLIAAGGALEKVGVEGGTRVGSKAGVVMLRQYLKGATLVAVRELFKKIGITFTRKALERALPFGIGVVLGATSNYALTKYIGAQAKQWFVLDRDTPHDDGAVGGHPPPVS